MQIITQNGILKLFFSKVFFPHFSDGIESMYTKIQIRFLIELGSWQKIFCTLVVGYSQKHWKSRMNNLNLKQRTRINTVQPNSHISELHAALVWRAMCKKRSPRCFYPNEELGQTNGVSSQEYTAIIQFCVPFIHTDTTFASVVWPTCFQKEINYLSLTSVVRVKCK